MDLQNSIRGREVNKKKSSAALALLALSEDIGNEVPDTACQATPPTCMKDSATQTEISGPTYQTLLDMSDEQCKMIKNRPL